MVRGAQVDVSFEGEIEERGNRLDMTVDRSLWTFRRSELHPRTDVAEVGVFDELRAGQGYGERSNVGATDSPIGSDDGPQPGKGASVRGAEETEADSRLKPQRGAARGSVEGGRSGSASLCRDHVRHCLLLLTGGRVEGKVRSIESNVDRLVEERRTFD